MLLIRQITLICTLLAVPMPAGAGDTCASKQAIARLIADEAQREGRKTPEFRITAQADGQALLYWRHGIDSRSFYAVTFRPDGCAVLTDTGHPRRFVFPISAYNTGVFEEMAVFDGAG